MIMNVVVLVLLAIAFLLEVIGLVKTPSRKELAEAEPMLYAFDETIVEERERAQRFVVAGVILATLGGAASLSAPGFVS